MSLRRTTGELAFRVLVINCTLLPVTSRKAFHFSRLEIFIFEMRILNNMVSSLGFYKFLTDKLPFCSQGFSGIMLLCICPSLLLKYGILRSGFIWNKRIDIKWNLFFGWKQPMNRHILICWLMSTNSLHFLCSKRAQPVGIIYDIVTRTIQKFWDFFLLKCHNDFNSKNSLYAAKNANSCSWYFLKTTQ